MVIVHLAQHLHMYSSKRFNDCRTFCCLYKLIIVHVAILSTLLHVYALGWASSAWLHICLCVCLLREAHTLLCLVESGLPSVTCVSSQHAAALHDGYGGRPITGAGESLYASRWTMVPAWPDECGTTTPTHVDVVSVGKTLVVMATVLSAKTSMFMPST